MAQNIVEMGAARSRRATPGIVKARSATACTRAGGIPVRSSSTGKFLTCRTPPAGMGYFARARGKAPAGRMKVKMRNPRTGAVQTQVVTAAGRRSLARKGLLAGPPLGMRPPVYSIGLDPGTAFLHTIVGVSAGAGGMTVLDAALVYAEVGETEEKGRKLRGYVQLAGGAAGLGLAYWKRDTPFLMGLGAGVFSKGLASGLEMLVEWMLTPKKKEEAPAPAMPPLTIAPAAPAPALPPPAEETTEVPLFDFEETGMGQAATQDQLRRIMQARAALMSGQMGQFLTPDQLARIYSAAQRGTGLSGNGKGKGKGAGMGARRRPASRTAPMGQRDMSEEEWTGSVPNVRSII